MSRISTTPKVDRFWLDLADPTVHDAMAVPRLERAIGSSIAPRPNVGVTTSTPDLGEQFDAVIHLDRTRRSSPLSARHSGMRGASGDLSNRSLRILPLTAPGDTRAACDLVTLFVRLRENHR